MSRFQLGATYDRIVEQRRQAKIDHAAKSAERATYPTIRYSDPPSKAPVHERGCIVGPDEDRYVCVTHGLTLAWMVA